MSETRRAELEWKRQRLAELKKARRKERTSGIFQTDRVDYDSDSGIEPTSLRNSIRKQRTSRVIIDDDFVGGTVTEIKEPAIKTCQSEQYFPKILTQTPVAVSTYKPKEIETYGKQVQTSPMSSRPASTRSSVSWEDFWPSGKTLSTASEKPPTVDEARQIKEDEFEEINQSEQFQSFVMRASRMVERALIQPDVCADYRKLIMSDYIEAVKSDVSNDILDLVTTFADDCFGSRNRLVTSIDFSTTSPELLLASYWDCKTADPPGLLLVWNTKFPGVSPEFVFTAESPVITACFAPFHANLIVGATYSGQVLVWDIRSPHRTPISRTHTSFESHTHPIIYLKSIGSRNANSLISVSNDGHLCAWVLENFGRPSETLNLTYRAKEVNATCCSFFGNSSNRFVVGTEDGAVITACRHGNKEGMVNLFDDRHRFGVTAIDTHPANGPVDFSNLILSASHDWTVKLWSTHSTATYVQQFREGLDSTTDVRWSPIHPALFASSNGTGRIYLYNLNTYSEVPLSSVTVENGKSTVRCLSWSPSGLMLAAGTESGRVHLYNINEGVAIPKSNEWHLFSSTINAMVSTPENRDEKLPVLGLVSPSRMTQNWSTPVITSSVRGDKF